MFESCCLVVEETLLVQSFVLIGVTFITKKPDELRGASRCLHLLSFPLPPKQAGRLQCVLDECVCVCCNSGLEVSTHKHGLFHAVGLLQWSVRWLVIEVYVCVHALLLCVCLWSHFTAAFGQTNTGSVSNSRSQLRC